MFHPGVVSITLNTSGSGTGRIAHAKNGIIWVIRQLAVTIKAASVVPETLVCNLGVTIDGFPWLTPKAVFSGAAASGEPPMMLGATEIATLTVTDGPASGSVVVSYYYEETH